MVEGLRMVHKAVEHFHTWEVVVLCSLEEVVLRNLGVVVLHNSVEVDLHNQVEEDLHNQVVEALHNLVKADPYNQVEAVPHNQVEAALYNLVVEVPNNLAKKLGLSIQEVSLLHLVNLNCNTLVYHLFLVQSAVILNHLDKTLPKLIAIQNAFLLRSALMIENSH